MNIVNIDPMPMPPPNFMHDAQRETLARFVERCRPDDSILGIVLSGSLVSAAGIRIEGMPVAWCSDSIDVLGYPLERSAAAVCSQPAQSPERDA